MERPSPLTADVSSPLNSDYVVQRDSNSTYPGVSKFGHTVVLTELLWTAGTGRYRSCRSAHRT